MPNQYVDYGCCNLVNGCRTLAYLKNANHVYGDPMCFNSNIYGNCSCCIELDGDDLPASGSFVSPVADPAPWYNADDPRSQHYLGAMIYDQWKESQPYSRETIDTGTGGRAKKAKLQRKEILVRFILLVDDCCAIPFAKATFLDQFICATSAEGACELPALHWHECYNTADCGDNQHSIRGFPRAAPTSVVWIDDEIDCCIGTIAEVTFTSELPWVYEVCPEVITTDYPIIGGDVECNICKPDCPPPSVACEPPCSPFAIDIPVDKLESCFCEPPAIYSNCFAIAPDNRIGDSTLVVKIYTGSSPLRNFRVKAYANKFGATNPEYFKCEEPCIDMAIAGPVPAYSIIEINGMTRDVWITCNNFRANARNWVESGDGGPFSWPDISCDGLLICLEGSGVEPEGQAPHTAADASISIDRYHRELR
jgi:hypothetical protein